MARSFFTPIPLRDAGREEIEDILRKKKEKRKEEEQGSRAGSRRTNQGHDFCSPPADSRVGGGGSLLRRLG